MLQKNIKHIKGIGEKKAQILAKEAGILTIEDLLYYAPRKYVDKSNFQRIIDCLVNQVVTVSGTIQNVTIQQHKRKFLKVEIHDGTDSLSGIFFGAISFFQRLFVPGDTVLFAGKITFYKEKQMIHPDFDLIENLLTHDPIHTGRIIPLYKSSEKLKTYGFTSRGFRKIIAYALETYLSQINDPFPKQLREKYNLLDLQEAIYTIHFPKQIEDAHKARIRLAFNELFFMHYYLAISKKYVQSHDIVQRPKINKACFLAFLDNLPFTLTNDQKKALDEIKNDLHNSYPMNRLLQGDVGSGKTVVALGAALMIKGQEYQTALMAPTEVLASQHYTNLIKLSPKNIVIHLLTGNTPAKKKKHIIGQLQNGMADIIIGTHALIQENIVFKNLGLIIIDEQHRFGVHQRATLREKGHHPHMLVMTATPIPRSLALSLYGDLEVSYIREKPADRKPVKTLSFPESRIKGVYNSIEKYLRQGRQCFYVLPLIQESEKIDLKSAQETYDILQKQIFPHRKVALLHGKLKAEEKESIMDEFYNGTIDILVSTTVIEVGIDVKNANIIVIHHAERFGLSQLHQLRGRVGRGSSQSFCVLIYPDNISQDALHRIKTLEETNDGFRIAEKDLNIRGAGEILGTRQHGFNADFEFADLVHDLELIIIAKNEASHAVEKIENIEKIIKSDLKNEQILKGIRTKKILSLLS